MDCRGLGRDGGGVGNSAFESRGSGVVDDFRGRGDEGYCEGCGCTLVKVSDVVDDAVLTFHRQNTLLLTRLRLDTPQE